MLATLNVKCRDIARRYILTLLQAAVRHPVQRPFPLHHPRPRLHPMRGLSRQRFSTMMLTTSKRTRTTWTKMRSSHPPVPLLNHRTPRSHTDSVLDVLYMVGSKDFPMAPVSCRNSPWVNGNRRNKLTSRICQGVVSPIWWALGPSWGRPTLGRPNPRTASLHIYSAAASIETWVWFIC
jgi:hypothetical protein